ncbi:hypothetical protein SAMN06297251_101405 [Fulvimarina manganoxydans]|uniref:Uncharacterized protein n=1 Tax=Fulvimarina manganoxydans TaxID=937218 RepID=A0A1W1YKB8_9HYPH|nr:hypothetical protein SAMN06297251_101405 [Fulvimarina manganoxydans]
MAKNPAQRFHSDLVTPRWARPSLALSLVIGLTGLGGVSAVSIGESAAQPFGPGPAGTLPGTSSTGQRIVGAPPPPSSGLRIPNAEVFGDTVLERQYGREFDDSYLKPKVPQPQAGNSATEQAIQGRSGLSNPAADFYSRQGPSAIGGSSISGTESRGRRHPAEGGRAIIRR